MSLKEYSFKFVTLSEYSSYVVSSRTDDISRFVTGVSEDLEKECLAAMSHDNIDLSRFMEYAYNVEESLKSKRGRECKKPRPLDQDNSSIGRSSFGVQDRPKLMKGHLHSGNTTP